MGNSFNIEETVPKTRERNTYLEDASSFPRRTLEANFGGTERQLSQLASPTGLGTIEFEGSKRIKDPERMLSVLEREKKNKDNKVRANYEVAASNVFGDSYRQMPSGINFPSGRNSALGPRTSVSPSLAELAHDPYAEKRGIIPLTNLSIPRQEYSTLYGIRPEQLPYQDEVDLIHESPDRYQEMNHWYNREEKPTEDNIEILKKTNHDRLDILASQYKKGSLDDYSDLQRFLTKKVPGFDEDFIKNSVVKSKRTKKQPNPIESAVKKERYNQDFEDYLMNKREKEMRGQGNMGFMVDFDRYECTSPDPKRVKKDHSLLYKENV